MLQQLLNVLTGSLPEGVSTRDEASRILHTFSGLREQGVSLTPELVSQIGHFSHERSAALQQETGKVKSSFNPLELAQRYHALSHAAQDTLPKAGETLSQQRAAELVHEFATLYRSDVRGHDTSLGFTKPAAAAGGVGLLAGVGTAAFLDLANDSTLNLGKQFANTVVQGTGDAAAAAAEQAGTTVIPRVLDLNNLGRLPSAITPEIQGTVESAVQGTPPETIPGAFVGNAGALLEAGSLVALGAAAVTGALAVGRGAARGARYQFEHEDLLINKVIGESSRAIHEGAAKDAALKTVANDATPAPQAVQGL